MVNAIDIAVTGLKAATRKMEAAASNIANVSTSGALDGNKKPPPYDHLTTTQTADQNGAGVKASLMASGRPYVPQFDPDSPLADENGIIGLPAVNLAEEAVNLKIAQHSYKANIEVIKAAEDMQDSFWNIFDKEV